MITDHAFSWPGSLRGNLNIHSAEKRKKNEFKTPLKFEYNPGKLLISNLNIDDVFIHGGNVTT